MEDFRDITLLIGYVLAVVASILAIIVGGILWGAAWQCHGYQEATGLPTKFIAADCYVQEHGVWKAYGERVISNATKGQ